jgi:transposase-like protein
MSERKRRTFQPELILKILKKHLVDKVPISELCTKHNITPTDFYRWQKRLFEQGEGIFERGHSGNSEMKRLNEKVDSLQDKIARKDEVLGELMEEHVRLKKNLGEI